MSKNIRVDGDPSDRPEGPEIPAFTAVVVDVAAAYGDGDVQSALVDFIWHLLERSYQIFLCATKEIERFAAEEFQDPQLVYLRGALPPSEAALEAHPALLAPTTLWISDDPTLQLWIMERGLPYVFPGKGAASFAPALALKRFSELAALLDPTQRTLREVARVVAAQRAASPGRALLVGIGGPPLGGMADFALRLKRELEDQDVDVANLLDLSAFLAASDDLPAPNPTAPWKDAQTEQWLLDQVVIPLAQGRRVYVERRPEAVPKDFDPHFPLFLPEDSVLLLFGELLFVVPLRERLHLSILLEVSPRETARRLYEIPPGEVFDQRFPDQYRKGQGAIYQAYLDANGVAARVDLRINGEVATALHLEPVEEGRN